MRKLCGATDLQFNASKSIAMGFGAQPCADHRLEPLTFCGGHVQWQNEVKHLGNYIEFNLKENREINVKRGDLIGSQSNDEHFW